MGAWSVGLYSNDFSLDLRGCIAAVARLPFEPGRLLDTVCMAEPSAAYDVTDSDHTMFWLVVADQFAKRGIDCPMARDRALAIIADGTDLTTMAALGMDEKSLAKRRAMLDKLRARITAPVAATKPRDMLKAPQKLLLEVGEVLTYPVCQKANDWEPINPYAVGKEWAWVKAWKRDGWGAIAVAERGLLFDFLAWYRPLVAYQALAREPTMAELAAPRAWTLRQAGTLSGRHYVHLQLKSIGRISIDQARLDYFFPDRGVPVGPVISDYSVSGSFNCHTQEPDDAFWDMTSTAIKPRLCALVDIEAGIGAGEVLDPRNLSGHWRGEYSYDEGGRAPASFLAALNEIRGLVRGTIDDIAGVTDKAWRPLKAVVDGRRAGPAVRLLKRYVSATKRYVPIEYDGEFDETGRRIEGRWSIRSGSSGRFVMIRAEPEA
jgi:hypothetical protein